MAAGGGGGQQTGFFYFDTNIGQIVTDVEGGMARLQHALANGTAVDQGAFAVNVQAVRQGISRIVDELTQGGAEINALIAKIGNGPGQITESQALQQLQAQAKAGVTELRGRYTREMAQVPSVILDRLPVADMGRQMANDYLDSFFGTVSALSPTLGAQLNKFQFGNDIKQAQQFDIQGTKPQLNPATGQMEDVRLVGRIEQLRMLQRAQEMVAKTAGVDPFGQLSETQLAEKEAGMARLTKMIRDQAIAEKRLQWHSDPNNPKFDHGSFAPDTSIPRELNALEQANRLGQQAAGDRERRNKAAADQAEREQKAVQETARASMQVQHGSLDKYAGLYLDPNGLWLKRTAKGGTDPENPLDVAHAEEALWKQREAQANMAALNAALPGQVDKSGPYRRYQGDLFKVNGDGTEAERVTSLQKIKELNESIDQAMGKQVVTAERLMATDEARAAAAEHRALLEAQARARGQAGFVGGFSDRFSNNDKMSASTALGSSIASAAKFSLAYGALFGLQSALRDVLSEFKDYQDSYTDLQVATRDTDAVTGDFVNSLGELARVSGSNVGAALDTAARAVRAFGDPLGNSTQELQDIGEAANSAATKLALIADKSLQDATGDTISVGTAFGLAPDQLTQVVDAIANAKRTLGGDPAQVAQGLSLIAGAAQEAGYNLNEAAAVISLVQARTDQSGQAIATRLTRVFQIVSGSTGKALSRELGVNANSSVKNQLEEYAKIYSRPNTSEAVKDRISSALGGTANLRELLPLLKEGSRLQAAYKEALDNAGQGSSEFTRKSENLVGTLKKIAGTLSAIEVQLANSGIFDAVGAAIYTLEPALHAVDRLLQAYNELPRSLRTVLGLLIDIALASKLMGAVQAHKAASAAAALAAGAEEGAVAGAGMKAAMGGSIATGGKALAAAAINPYTLAAVAVTAGLVAYDKYHTGVDQITGFNKTAAGTSNAFDRLDGSAASIRAAAADLHSAAGDIAGSPSNFLSKGDQKDLSQQLDDRSTQVASLARRVSDEERRLAAKADVGVFGNGVIETVDQLGEGLTAMTAAGQSAVTQLRLVRKALMTDTVPDKEVRFARQRDTTMITLGIGEALKAAMPDVVGMKQYDQKISDPTEKDPYHQSYMLKAVTGEEAYNKVMAGVDLKAIRQRILEQAVTMGMKTGDKVDPLQISKLVDLAVQQIDLSDIPKQANAIREGVANQIKIDVLGWQTQDFGAIPGFGLPGIPLAVGYGNGPKGKMDMLNGSGPLSAKQFMGLFNANESGTWPGLPALMDASLGAISPFDTAVGTGDHLSPHARAQGELKGQIHLLRFNKQRILDAGDKVPEVLVLEIQRLRDQYVQGKVDELERLRRVAQNDKGLSKKQLKNIGAHYLQKEIIAAGADAAQMIKVIEGADNQILDIVEAHLKMLAKVARAARLSRLHLLEAGGTGNAGSADYTQGALDDASQPSDAERNYRRFKRNRDAADAVPNKGSKYSGTDSPNADASSKAKQHKSDLYEAQQNAIAARSGTQIAQDRAALNIARYHLAHAKEGSQKWWEAQAELSNAQRSYANDQRQFGVSAAAVQASRLGGGIASARSAIIAARAGLAEYAKGTVEYNEQLAGLFDAQRQMRDALVQYRINKFQLHGDITDPVENARDALKGALAQLRADAGSGKDVKAADRVAVRQDQQSLLAAKFSQRLSDVQTAEQLGKISHQAYVRYLENEHDRLERIKNKTRQQKDQLNQIDLALKEAVDSADGQFNLGDINTNGLVYQVRRFNAEQRAMVGADGGPRGPYQNGGRPVVQQSVQIQIDGADTAKIKSVLTSVLGSDVGHRRTLRSRKV